MTWCDLGLIQLSSSSVAISATKSSKDKYTASSFKKGKAQSQPSKTVNAEETIEEHVQEVAMDFEELVKDKVVNVEEHPQDDFDPTQDKST
nr:hypothetical protein [Tanacetum cinerariifolium]